MSFSAYKHNSINAVGNPGSGNSSISFQNAAGPIKFKQFTIFTEPLCDGGVLKFADQTHLNNFFAALKARCKKENLSDLYEIFYNNVGATCQVAPTDVPLSCVEKDGSPQSQFTRARRFKKIAAYIYKITLPKNVKIFAHLKDTEIHNWPPAEKREFFIFCKNNMNRTKYNQFAAQVNGSKINLPVWDKINVWCAEVNIANPGKLAAEIQKHVTLGPALNGACHGMPLQAFLAPYRKQIAEGKLVEAYVYLDNKTDANGYLIPRVCLIPNKPLNIAYFNQLKARHFYYTQIQDIFSPQAVRRVCNKLDEWNILERGFSYLDLALLPALSKINNETGKSALLEIYGVLMVFRQLHNPVSWLRFMAGLSLLGEDITKIVKVWEYGTSAERALVVGSIIGLLFGPKAFKAANEFFADSVIAFQARKIGAGPKIQVQKGGKVYLIIPNKKTGFVTIIRDDGTAVAFKKDANGNLTAVTFRAAKGSAPKGAAVMSRKPSPATKPAYAQPRRGGYRAQDLRPAPTPTTAMSVLAEAGKRMRIAAAAPVTRSINTVREMIATAAALMADGINNTAAGLAGTNGLRPACATPSTGNIPAQTARPTQMMSEGKPKDVNPQERQEITGKPVYDPAEPIGAEKKAELIRKLKGMSREDGLALIHKTIRDIEEDYMQNVFLPNFARQIRDIGFGELINEFGGEDKIPEEAWDKKTEEMQRRLPDIFIETKRTTRRSFLDGLQALYIELRDALLNERSSPLGGNERLADDIIFAVTESEREPIRDVIKELSPVVLSNLREAGVLITIEEGEWPRYYPISRMLNVYSTSSPYEFTYKTTIFHEVFHALCKNPKTMEIIKEVYGKICHILKNKDAGTMPRSSYLKTLIADLDASPPHQHCKGNPRPSKFYEELTGLLFAAFFTKTADIGGVEIPVSYIFRMEEPDLFNEMQNMVSLLNENSGQNISTAAPEETDAPSLNPDKAPYNPGYFLGEVNKSVDKLRNSALNNYQWISNDFNKCNLMLTSLFHMISLGTCKGREQELVNAVMGYYELILKKANNLPAAGKARVLLDFKEKVIPTFRENEALRSSALELYLSLTEDYRTQGITNYAVAPLEYINLERIARNKRTYAQCLFEVYFADKLNDGQAERNFNELFKKIASGEYQNNKTGPPPPTTK